MGHASQLCRTPFGISSVLLLYGLTRATFWLKRGNADAVR
jgi:hypothetical protein